MKKSDEIIRLAKEGKSIQEIADLLGYKRTYYISRVLEKNNQPVRRQDKNGDSIWELHGLWHREDGPAIEKADGTRKWYLHGKRYRRDGPAYEYAVGTREWWWEDKRHREDGPAIEYANGNRTWYWHGKCHREDGPAVEYSLDKVFEWYYRPGSSREWHWRGKKLEVKSQEEFEILKPLLMIQEVQEL